MRRLARVIAARRGGAGIGVPASSLLELARGGPASLSSADVDPDGLLRIAVVIPSFRRGSGGHGTIVRLLLELRERGHEVSLWLEDCEGRHAAEREAAIQSSFERFFDTDGLPLHANLDSWGGADIVLATGWQTVARTLLLGGAASRAYLVQDHEPDFYGASAEALWAAETYRLGLHCIAASAWLAGLLHKRYGASVTHFDLAVDPSRYRPGAGARGDDLLAFYARAATPRRATPLGLAALTELSTRRPGTEIVLYGEAANVSAAAAFPHRNLGILGYGELVELYNRAAVGMVLSLTNPSLVALEMMACGLPCVELASDSMLTSFDRDGPLVLADPDPLSLCGALERLLDDAAAREHASRAGIELMAGRTWARAAEQVERGLRTAVAAARRRTPGTHLRVGGR